MIQNRFDKRVAEESRHKKALDAVLQEMSEQCIDCGICVKQCGFLKKYGTPKKIADAWQPPAEQSWSMPFECSLCSLCTAVCPVKIDPRQMFLEMRRYAVAAGNYDFQQQKPLIKYERRGISKRYSFYGLPPGCDTVLFPGCALAGSRAHRVMQLYDHLQGVFPNLGIVLDCCTKPSHDLGRADFFHAVFSEMLQYLGAHNIKTILAACPSCYTVFRQYAKRITTRSVYEVLAGEYWQFASQQSQKPLTIQDSCVARFEEGMQQAVRRLINGRGIHYEEMKHHGKKTICCGEGGGAHFVAPELAGNWAARRRSDVGSRRIIAYCSGCAHFLRRIGPTVHLLDLLFDPAKTLSGRARVARAPFTYLQRLLLKRRFRKKMNYGVTRERDFVFPA